MDKTSCSSTLSIGIRLKRRHDLALVYRSACPHVSALSSNDPLYDVSFPLPHACLDLPWSLRRASGTTCILHDRPARWSAIFTFLSLSRADVADGPVGICTESLDKGKRL